MRIVFFLGALEGFLSVEIEVFQIPEVHATAGSNVFLPCTYNISGVENATIGSYKWYRHLVKTGPEVSDSNKDFSGRISRATTEQFISDRSAHLTIHNVNSTDTGNYYCEVAIYGGITGNGRGTMVNVTEEAGGSNSTNPIIYIIMSLGAVFGIVVVIVLVVGCYRICNHATGSPVETGPIVYTEFSTLDRRQRGPRGPEVVQNEEMSHYMMENQQYNLFLPEHATQKAVASPYQELDLYSVIP
ncbi:uncharacterized protein ACNLHF_027230 [Anomaloglossus baeobatrachus]